MTTKDESKTEEGVKLSDEEDVYNIERRGKSEATLIMDALMQNGYKFPPKESQRSFYDRPMSGPLNFEGLYPSAMIASNQSASLQHPKMDRRERRRKR